MLIENMNICITLAPRAKQTVNHCIESLRKAWIENKIYIFAEPWKYIIKDKNIELKIHEKKMWCFLNYDYVLRKMFRKKKYLRIVQDDYHFRKWTKEELEHIISDKKKFGFYNMYLAGQHVKYITWNNIREDSRFGWHSVWACYVMKKWVIKQLLNHKFYLHHKEVYVPTIWNQQIDACIWECFKQMELATYYPITSWAAHIGEESTIWHTDRNNNLYKYQTAKWKHTS